MLSQQRADELESKTIVAQNVEVLGTYAPKGKAAK